MRKMLLIISLLAVLVIAASSAYTKLYRLTIINKSGMEMAIIHVRSVEGTAVPEQLKGIGKDSPCRSMVNA